VFSQVSLSEGAVSPLVLLRSFSLLLFFRKKRCVFFFSRSRRERRHALLGGKEQDPPPRRVRGVTMFSVFSGPLGARPSQSPVRGDSRSSGLIRPFFFFCTKRSQLRCGSFSFPSQSGGLAPLSSPCGWVCGRRLKGIFCPSLLLLRLYRPPFPASDASARYVSSL